MSDIGPKPAVGGPQFVVVGAGAAGLAAAWTLASRSPGDSSRIVVLEASDRIGGRMFCEEIDGFHVHGGASVIHESMATARDLAQALNVELLPSPRRKGGNLYAGGRFWGAYVKGTARQKLTTLRTFLFSPQFTFAGLWEIARLFRILRKRAGDLDFEDHARMLDLDTRESFADFARANSLTRYLNQAGELDLDCFTAGSSTQVGAAFGMALLWQWSLNPAARSHLPRQGIAALAKALAGATAEYVRVSTPVERIVIENGTATGVVTAGGETIPADAVICTTTASVTGRIVPDLPEVTKAALGRVTYSACCNIAFGLDANILPEDSHAGLFPPGAPTFLTMVTDLKAVTPDAAPPGKSLVHALVTGGSARELFALDDEEAIRRTVAEMRRFFPAMPQSPLFARVYRWPEAVCLTPGGMLKEMHNIRIAQPNGMRALFLAGDYTRLPSLNGAMKSGVEAAKASLTHVASASA